MERKEREQNKVTLQSRIRISPAFATTTKDMRSATGQEAPKCLLQGDSCLFLSLYRFLLYSPFLALFRSSVLASSFFFISFSLSFLLAYPRYLFLSPFLCSPLSSPRFFSSPRLGLPPFCAGPRVTTHG